MPSWGVHLGAAKKILEIVNIQEKNDFIFGNILPDIQNGYVIKDTSKIVKHRDTHYDDFPKTQFEYHNKFYGLYKENMNNKVVLGYFVHLMTDSLWNKEFYTKKVKFEDGEIVRSKFSR